MELNWIQIFYNISEIEEIQIYDGSDKELTKYIQSNENLTQLFSELDKVLCSKNRYKIGVLQGDKLLEAIIDSGSYDQNLAVHLPSKIDWQTNFFYRGPSENSQTKNKGIAFTNMAFSKDVFSDKGTITFNVSDLFNSAKRRSYTETAFFTSDSEFQWRVRQFTLGFVYRFNQPKGKTKQRQPQQQNDDDEE